MSTFSIPLIVEVAIAIIVSWALFAVFCSMVHESIVQIKSERGRFTKKMIQKQLMDYPNNMNWGSLLYLNSRIDLLSRAYNKPPSVIESSTFAQALIEAVASSHVVQSVKTKNPSLAVSYNNQTLNDFKLATTHSRSFER